VDVALDADRVFPRKVVRRKKLCGWNEFVRPYKEECTFWYDMWRGPGGKQKHGYFYEKMREAKRQCMYAVRRTKRRQEELQEERTVEALANGSPRDFCKEVKKQMPRKPVTDCIDGIVGDEAIAQHFKEKYNALYCSVPSDAAAMQRVEQAISSGLENSTRDPPVISREDVAAAVRKLKYGKHDGEAGYNSNHLLYASAEYYEHVAHLFTAMYIHGHQPETIIRGTICSIPKDPNKSLQDGTNYRGICLCSAISKVLEIIFVKRNSRFMETSDMQYAFKKGTGTTTCSLMLKEVVKYYRSRGSRVYVNTAATWTQQRRYIVSGLTNCLNFCFKAESRSRISGCSWTLTRGSECEQRGGAVDRRTSQWSVASVKVESLPRRSSVWIWTDCSCN
jgi:hypothetical protein